MPVVFLSYSHDSDAHRDNLLALAKRLRDDGIDARLDQFLNGAPPEGWPRWMSNELDRADFVLVVCTKIYYHRFRGLPEEPGKGHGADWEGSLIAQELYDSKSKTAKFVPVMFQAEDAAFIPKPLRKYSSYLLTEEKNYQQLYDFLLGQAGAKLPPLGPLKTRSPRDVSPLRFADNEQKISPTRLTHVADRLFGRETRLADLEAAWLDPKIHVVTLVAWGGVGKTSLVAKWVDRLASRNYDGADYFDWSFYSQGATNTSNASADAFVDAALRFFGDVAMADSPTSAWDKGARLANLLASRRALLILDGLEPLQHPPGPLAGELKDPAVTALLRGLAQKNAGLCVVTTRERVADLGRWEDNATPRWPLEHLSIDAGFKVLDSLGVHGSAAEMKEAVAEVKGHSLTLH